MIKKTKKEKKEINAAICSDYIKSIERMQDYYKAFKMYSNEKLDNLN